MSIWTLKKTDGRVSWHIYLRVDESGTIHKTVDRLSNSITSKVTTYPPKAYEPMTAQEMINSIINQALSDGYVYDSVTGSDARKHEACSILVRMPKDSWEKLEQVAGLFGHPVVNDPTTLLVKIDGTHFQTTAINPEIRLAATVNITSCTPREPVLRHHIALARCLSDQTCAYLASGDPVDLMDFLVMAWRSGQLSEQEREALYECKVLKRPLVISPAGVKCSIPVTF